MHIIYVYTIFNLNYLPSRNQQLSPSLTTRVTVKFVNITKPSPPHIASLGGESWSLDF